MNFIANRTNLHKAVKNAMRAISNNKSIPELNGLLFEADANSGIISITGTDIQTQIQCRVKADHILEGGSCIINPVVSEMLRLLPEDNVEIANSFDCRMLDIKSGKSQYTIPYMSSEKFPKMQIPFPEDFICVKGLNSVIKRTVVATDNSKDVSSERKSLQHIKLSFANGQTKAEATDGNIAAVSEIPFGSDGNLDLILHEKAMGILTSIVQPDEDLYVGTTGKFAMFMKQDMFFSSMLYDGRYIEGSKLVEYVKPQFKATADAKELFNLADNVSTIFSADDDRCINVCIADNKVSMQTKTYTGNSRAEISATDTIPTSAEGFNYNAKWLLNCLKQATGPLTMSMDQRGFLLIEANQSKYCVSPRGPVNVRVPKQKVEKEKKPRKTKSKAKTTTTIAA